MKAKRVFIGGIVLMGVTALSLIVLLCGSQKADIAIDGVSCFRISDESAEGQEALVLKTESGIPVSIKYLRTELHDGYDVILSARCLEEGTDLLYWVDERHDSFEAEYHPLGICTQLRGRRAVETRDIVRGIRAEMGTKSSSFATISSERETEMTIPLPFDEPGSYRICAYLYRAKDGQLTGIVEQISFTLSIPEAPAGDCKILSAWRSTTPEYTTVSILLQCGGSGMPADLQKSIIVEEGSGSDWVECADGIRIDMEKLEYRMVDVLDDAGRVTRRTAVPLSHPVYQVEVRIYGRDPDRTYRVTLPTDDTLPAGSRLLVYVHE